MPGCRCDRRSCGPGTNPGHWRCPDGLTVLLLNGQGKGYRELLAALPGPPVPSLQPSYLKWKWELQLESRSLFLMLDQKPPLSVTKRSLGERD